MGKGGSHHGDTSPLNAPGKAGLGGLYLFPHPEEKKKVNPVASRYSHALRNPVPNPPLPSRRSPVLQVGGSLAILPPGSILGSRPPGEPEWT